MTSLSLLFRNPRPILVLTLLSALFTMPARPTAQATGSGIIDACVAQGSVCTQHNDNQRTGANLKETVLTPTVVGGGSFQKLFACEVDGPIYAQPLYVSGLTLEGQVRNVVFVATMHNKLYAFDGDDPSCHKFWTIGPTGGPSGFQGFGAPIDVYSPTPGTFDCDTNNPNCDKDRPHLIRVGNNQVYRANYLDIFEACQGPYPDVTEADPSGGTHSGKRVGSCAKIGIMGTPVIDIGMKRIYYVVATGAGAGQHFTLYATDLLDGSVKASTPIDPDNSFVPDRAIQRPALLLHNSSIYVTLGARPDYQAGQVLRYRALTSPSDASLIFPGGTPFVVVKDQIVGQTLGGIWQAGQGPSADDSGRLYLMTGNGGTHYDANTNQVATPPRGAPDGQSNFISSFVQLNADLSVASSFTAPNWAYLDVGDTDLGASGPIVLKDPDRVIGGSKQGRLYLFDTGPNVLNSSAGYMGCFVDKPAPNRALPMQFSSSGDTIETCKAKARNAKYLYAGVQWYGECWAGNDVLYEQVPESQCNTPCANGEMCGGAWRNSIYSTSLMGLKTYPNSNGTRSSSVQATQAATVNATRFGTHIHGSPIYWKSADKERLYVWGENDHLRQLTIDPTTQRLKTVSGPGNWNQACDPDNSTLEFKDNSGNILLTLPESDPIKACAEPERIGAIDLPLGMPGGFLSLSANGSDPNSGVIWTTSTFSTQPTVGGLLPFHDWDTDGNHSVVPGVLRAFDAVGLNEVWDSEIDAGRDRLGNFAKYTTPTIANGKVYVAASGDASYMTRSAPYNVPPYDRSWLVVYGVYSRCEIAVSNSCTAYPQYSFPLNDSYAPFSQSACMARAQDYFYWCKASNSASAAFYRGGSLLQSTMVNTKCIVDIPSCPNHLDYANTAYWDNYNNSGYNQAACLARPLDFKNWCGTTSNVHASYYVNGVIQGTSDSNSAPPQINLVYSAGVSGPNSMVAISGSSFIPTADNVTLNCGASTVPNSISSESTSQITIATASTPADRSCSVQVTSAGQSSNTVSMTIPGVAPPPNIGGASYSGVSGSFAYITMYGSNFQASGNTLSLVCGGTGTSVWSSYESTGQINIYFYTTPSARYCSIQVYANGQWSNVWSNIYVPPVVPPPAISNAYYAGTSGSLAYITILGSNFQASGNSVSLTCGGGTSDWISYESTGQINIYSYTTSWGRYCSVQVYANGQWSNVWSNIYVPPVVQAPSISSVSYAGASGGYSYLTIWGSNFGSSNYVSLSCYGGAFISSQSSNQINVYFPTPSSGVYCNVQVYSYTSGQWSNPYYSVYVPGGASSPPSIAWAGYAGYDGYWDYITLYGSNFGSSNYVYLYCNGTYTYDYISYQSSGQINIYFPAPGYPTYCSVQDYSYSSGQTSNTVYNIYVPQ